MTRKSELCGRGVSTKQMHNTTARDPTESNKRVSLESSKDIIDRKDPSQLLKRPWFRSKVSHSQGIRICDREGE